MAKNYKSGYINEIGPLKDGYMKGWHSIRHFLGVQAFGINGVTVNKGEDLVKQHDEASSNQQEVFAITEGSAEFEIDGEKLTLKAGGIVNIEPAAVRKAVALESPTTVLIIGAAPGEVYSPPKWELK